MYDDEIEHFVDQCSHTDPLGQGGAHVTDDDVYVRHTDFSKPGGSTISLASEAKQMILTQDHAERKGTPIATGVMDYFPKALAYVSRVSKAGNDQHNPGQPLHWDKTKSKDHADCIARHLIDRGTVDPTDGLSHSGKLAWRALALLETELGNGTS